MSEGGRNVNKSKQLILVVSIFLIINVALIAYYISKKNKTEESIIERNQIVNIVNQEFTFDAPAPDFTMPTISGSNITLSNLSGHVIILRFSRFYLPELPFLLYLEHLSQKFNNEIRLVFINSLGKHEINAIQKFVRISSPIIEDTGSLRSLFNARLNETIIIGRDYKIKFKNIYVDKKAIYDLVLRYAYGDLPPAAPSKEEIEELIKNLSFYNLETGKTESIVEKINERKSLINLSISTCMTCPETSRVHLIKELSEQIDLDKSQIIFLFGKGNNPKMLKDFIIRMGLDKDSVLAGVIEKGKLSDSEYYRIFQYDLDPRILIFEKGGKLKFLEKIRDARKLSDVNFLKEKLG